MTITVISKHNNLMMSESIERIIGKEIIEKNKNITFALEFHNNDIKYKTDENNNTRSQARQEKRNQMRLERKRQAAMWQKESKQES